MAASDDQQKLQMAVSLHQQGRLPEAANLYRALIATNAGNAQALHLLGLLEAGRGNFAEARPLLDRALTLEPSNLQLLENCAGIFFQMRDYRAALDISTRGLAINAASPALAYVGAVALFKLNQFSQSLDQFDKLLARDPGNVAAINERGAVLAKLQRHDEALASFEKALSVNPTYAEAHLNRAALYAEQDRADEALAGYDKALGLRPDLIMGWLGRGNVCCRLKRYDDALSAAAKALALNPNFAEAWSARGGILAELRQPEQALADYDKALVLDSELAAAWLGRGNVLSHFKRNDEAVAAYDKAIALDQDLASAWLGRGNACLERRQFAEALAAYDRALALKADLKWVEGLRLHCKAHLCDWSNFEAEREHLLASVEANRPAAPPLVLLAIPSTARQQLQCAQSWIAHDYPAAAKPLWQGDRYRHEKIRVAYLSGDFRQHAIPFLVVGMLECQDRSRFEMTALSTGPQDNSDIRKRMVACFDRFVDVRAHGDEHVANLIRSWEIDLLVDVAGLTQGGRPGVLAYRPAPVAVNYLGYPGTIGAPYYDYIVADRVLIPEHQKQFYSEKIVVLPHTYQANDAKRAIAQRTFTRADLGLPPTGVVFCCFNSGFKIMPDVFDSWMRIMKSVDGSVLWLFEENATAPDNLRREAAARGVDPARLLFGKPMAHDDHMARLGVADLLLDTSPYNAHTTGSDALWAGLPIVTCIGDTFASRVAASLLTAIGLPELVTPTRDAYEQLAIALGGNPAQLENIKRKLAVNRLTTPLFDTARYTRHLEAAYVTMHERCQAGLAAAEIVVPDIPSGG